MDSQVIVEVFVETSTGEWEVATGCLVASDRVLTVAHVFNERKPNGEVLVRVYRDGELSRVAIPIWPPSLADGNGPSQNDLDAAVLEITQDSNQPRLPEPRFRLRTASIRTMLNVEGRGFPRITRLDPRVKDNHDRPQAESFFGRCSHFEQGTPDRSIYLKADSGFTKRSDWQGASGFPLFAWNELVAIGRQYKASRPDTIDCVPVPRLISDVNFKTAIRFTAYEDRAAHLKDIRGELTALLRADAGIADKIEKINRQAMREHVTAEYFLEDKPAATADFLLAQDVLSLLRITDRVHRKFHSDPQQAGQDVNSCLDCLERIQNMFVPIAIRRILDREVETCLDSDPFEAPFTLPITAEALMAAIEGRDLSLVPLEPGSDDDSGRPSLVGSALLDDPPDRGLDGDLDAWAGDAMSDIARRRSPLQLTTHTLRSLTAAGMSQAEKNKHLANLLTEKLEDHAEQAVDGPRRFYFAIGPPDSEPPESRCD